MPLWQRVFPTIWYSIAALHIGAAIATLNQEKPIAHSGLLVFLATAGIALLAVAAFVSWFHQKAGCLCALIGSLLCWPEFISVVPWASLYWFAGHRQDLVTATLWVFVIGIYSGGHLRLLLRGPIRPRPISE